MSDKGKRAYSEQERLEMRIRFNLEKYEMAPTVEHRIKALQEIREASDYLKRWLELQPLKNTPRDEFTTSP